MNRPILATMGIVVAVACAGAAPPRHPGEPDPEPPKMVYHHFNVILKGDKRTSQDMRKLLAPLVLAKVQLITPDDEFSRMNGPKWRQYRVYIRTREPYEKVQAVIKAKPGVFRVWAPPPDISPRTVTKLPVPKFSVGIPLDAPHHPDCPVHHKKPKDPVLPGRD
jgi:hypothetical protein